MSERYDAIVVGVGSMGSAACMHLARRGLKTLGLERYDIPHTMGSHHGFTRIIRLAYYEDPSYVPLLRRAFELWRELEQGYGETLLHVTGTIDASGEDEVVFQKSLESCLLHDIPHDVLTGDELHERFPGYRLPSTHRALYQPDGGFLIPEGCIVAHTLAAAEAGATIKAREGVRSWQAGPDGVTVTTDKGVYHADQLVLSAGAWMGKLVPGFAPLAVPERQVLGWFQPLVPAEFRPETFPVFNLLVPEGRYYGFPVHGVPGFKIGRYHHLDEVVDPDDFDREPNARDEAVLREVTAKYFPDAAGETVGLRACMFTNTPDEHFIIDRLPGQPNVVVASPCSGHGFKFASVIGEIIADLV
ncbi:MAG: N-methyl-L-tryptophan oxidase, partial [Thermomicrobiales bacterium]